LSFAVFCFTTVVAAPISMPSCRLKLAALRSSRSWSEPFESTRIPHSFTNATLRVTVFLPEPLSSAMPSNAFSSA
jgi:hypothetical protein